MIDSFPFDAEAATTESNGVTIRVAEPCDEASIARLAALDGQEPGAGPHLLAIQGDRAVACLSLSDETCLADPFRRTEDAVSLLRLRAAQLADCGSGCKRPQGRRAERALVLGAVGAAVLALAATAGATPKPGLPAGTWVGKGTTSGVGTEGGYASTFSGGMTFSIVVGPNGKVTGTGTWTRKMVNVEPMPAVVSSRASVAFGGTPTAITYKGVAKTTMAVRYEGVTRTHAWKPLTVVQSLPIGRAGSCKAEGRSTVKGVTFRWSAVLKGAGTCRT